MLRISRLRKQTFGLTKLIRFRTLMTTDPPLSEQEIQSFQKDGAICLRGKFPQEWLEKAKEGIRKVYKNPSDYSEKITRGDDAQSKSVYFNDYMNWRRVKEISDFVFHSPASGLAKQLMSSEVIIK